MEDESRPSSSQADMTQDPTSTQTTDRRKSGRATRKPELLSQSYTDGTGSKRKRDAAGEDEDVGEEEEDQEVDDASESESNEEDADEEELREKKRAARKKSTKKASTTPKTKAKPRTTKKVKVAGNGIGGQLALRPAAANGKRTVPRPRKPKVRPSLAAGERGLYGMLLSCIAWVVSLLTIYQRRSLVKETRPIRSPRTGSPATNAISRLLCAIWST